MKGLIFSVKKYSVHDGPGIRVTFFMKGCPLNCMWCHNPEGILPYSQEVDQIRKIGQKEFVEKEQAGRYYSVDEVLEIIAKEDVFIKQSDGGVTFSGGEPMMQPEFLLEALRACKNKGYHTAVDTSGYAPEGQFRTVIPFTDLFLFDIKHLDDAKHSILTGVSNIQILSNYRLVLDSGKEMMIRFPVIPGKNDDTDHLERLRSFILNTKKENLLKMCLLPFHKTGSSKYKRFGMDYRMGETDQPAAERMKELKKYFAETGIMVKIGG
ncbi:MAG: glycyl-radical enzyme activating protein [Chloroflexota bacterium]